MGIMLRAREVDRYAQAQSDVRAREVKNADQNVAARGAK